MKAHIILAHPNSNSFNGQLVNVTKSKLESAGYEVTHSDLYANSFDPCEGPKHYQKLSSSSEHFHAQTEQRFHAENNTTPQDAAAERDKFKKSVFQSTIPQGETISSHIPKMATLPNPVNTDLSSTWGHLEL